MGYWLPEDFRNKALSICNTCIGRRVAIITSRGGSFKCPLLMSCLKFVTFPVYLSQNIQFLHVIDMFVDMFVTFHDFVNHMPPYFSAIQSSDLGSQSLLDSLISRLGMQTRRVYPRLDLINIHDF